MGVLGQSQNNFINTPPCVQRQGRKLAFGRRKDFYLIAQSISTQAKFFADGFVGDGRLGWIGQPEFRFGDIQFFLFLLHPSQ